MWCTSLKTEVIAEPSLLSNGWPEISDAITSIKTGLCPVLPLASLLFFEMTSELRDIGDESDCKSWSSTLRLTMACRKEQEVNKLIISNLPEDMDEDELTGMFKEYRLETVKLEIGKYAVLTFADDWGARKALKEWDKGLWRGHWLRVKPAQW